MWTVRARNSLGEQNFFHIHHQQLSTVKHDMKRTQQQQQKHIHEWNELIINSYDKQQTKWEKTNGNQRKSIFITLSVTQRRRLVWVCKRDVNMQLNNTRRTFRCFVYCCDSIQTLSTDSMPFSHNAHPSTNGYVARSKNRFWKTTIDGCGGFCFNFRFWIDRCTDLQKCHFLDGWTTVTGHVSREMIGDVDVICGTSSFGS